MWKTEDTQTASQCDRIIAYILSCGWEWPVWRDKSNTACKTNTAITCACRRDHTPCDWQHTTPTIVLVFISQRFSLFNIDNYKYLRGLIFAEQRLWNFRPKFPTVVQGSLVFHPCWFDMPRTLYTMQFTWVDVWQLLKNWLLFPDSSAEICGLFNGVCPVTYYLCVLSRRRRKLKITGIFYWSFKSSFNSSLHQCRPLSLNDWTAIDKATCFDEAGNWWFKFCVLEKTEFEFWSIIKLRMQIFIVSNFIACLTKDTSKKEADELVQ